MFTAVTSDISPAGVTINRSFGFRGIILPDDTYSLHGTIGELLPVMETSAISVVPNCSRCDLCCSNCTSCDLIATDGAGGDLITTHSIGGNFIAAHSIGRDLVAPHGTSCDLIATDGTGGDLVRSDGVIGDGEGPDGEGDTAQLDAGFHLAIRADGDAEVESSCP